MPDTLPSPTAPAPAKPRMEWLDAMRGFTMLLVVTAHVSGTTFDIQYRDSAVQPLIILFRMPLFFFVSGFLAYKASTVWTGATLCRSLLKKLRVQVLPAAVFLLAYSIYRYHDYFGHFLLSLGVAKKGGYWFTWVLLLMFVTYYLFAFAEQQLQRLVPRRFMRWLPIVVMLVASLALYETTYMPKYFTYPKSAWAQATSFNLYAEYLCFFVLGNICRRWWKQVERLFDSRWFFPVVVLLIFVCSVEIFHWHNLRFMWRNLPRTIVIFSVMSLVVMTFRHHERHLTRATVLGRAMQHIGTRTLDIYLIHYFFLPTMPCVGAWFRHHKGNMLPELAVTLAMALLVVAFSCLTSAVLRTSPILKKWLFGKES